MSFWNGTEWVAASPPAADVKREGRATHVAKALLEAGLVTALTFGLIAGTAFAGKGSSSAWLTVEWPANAAPVNPSEPVPYNVSGCGFNAALGGVTIVVTSPQSISFSGGPVNADGCISVGTTWYTQGAGHYDINAYQDVHRKSTKVASTSFDL